MEVSGLLHVSAALIPGKNSGTLLNRRLGVPQSQSDPYENDKNFLPLPGFEHRTIQPKE
jgi:hypothetical protein